MANVLIILALAALCGYGAYSYIHKLRHGGGCCGEHEAAPKRVKVEDRNRKHYPYTVIIRVDGMTCGNCALRVENALNRLPGTWAEVDLGARQATVLLKEPPQEQLLDQAVRDAGYLPLSIAAADA